MPMQDRLNAIREYEEQNLPSAEKARQPKFHLTGGVGWINDPNGFSVYKGEYHLFFQYYPYKTEWGLMHWGHAKTRDFIRWERLPAALAPDQEYDRDGCFSGSAVELENGKHLLMYTGVCRNGSAGDRPPFIQTQCIAIGDGLNYQKYAGNPVIDDKLLPEEASPEDFRDPRIWKDGNGFHAVIGNRSTDGSGTALLYDSRDALHWECRGVLASSQHRYGEMWECPDFFSLSGKGVLLVSIQGKIAEGTALDPRIRTACLIGSFDPEKCCLDPEQIVPVDHGTDFYAPQTLETPDGRRIMIAWMQNWESISSMLKELELSGDLKAQGFFGQMTVPRELTIDHGRLIQLPVQELDHYRGAKVRYKNLAISEETSLQGLSGHCLDMTVQIRPVEDTRLYKRFHMKVASDGEHFTSISYVPETGLVRVDRTRSGYFPDIENVREFPVRNRQGGLDLRLVMDRYSLELFVNGGEQAASFMICRKESADSITFACEGTALLDVEKYDLTGLHPAEG